MPLPVRLRRVRNHPSRRRRRCPRCRYRRPPSRVRSSRAVGSHSWAPRSSPRPRSATSSPSSFCRERPPPTPAQPPSPRTATGTSNQPRPRPYKTRIVVYRPIDPKHFDGTVVVEWLNVTAGIDAPAAWLNAHIQMIRDGMAYVGVDAQAGGINGQAGSIAAVDGKSGLRQSDPARYGSLHHPGRQLLVQHLPAGRPSPPDIGIASCSVGCTRSGSWPWASHSPPSGW